MQYAQSLRQKQQYAQYYQNQLAAKPKKQHRYKSMPDLTPSGSDAQPKEYESVWCNNGKAIGVAPFLRPGLLI